MNQEAILKQTEEHIKNIFSGEGPGHDWWHIYRVRKIAMERHRYMEQFLYQL